MNKETHDIFKCESRVAKVARIEILTKLRTIDVGNVETLQVLGYDEEGNVFSTLEGMRFEWTASEPDNLEFVSIKVLTCDKYGNNIIRIHQLKQQNLERKLKVQTSKLISLLLEVSRQDNLEFL